MTNDHTNDHDSKMARDSGGDSVPLRSERGLDHTTNSQSHASPEAGRELQRDPFEGIDFNKLRENPLLLAKVTAYLQENHLHLPILTPDRKEMAAMKEETPELYQEAYSAAGKTWFGWWLVEHYLPYHVNRPNSCGLGEPTRGRKDPPYFHMGYGSLDNIADLVDSFVESFLPVQ